MKLTRRSAGVLALLLTAVLLTGCSYVNRVAARINPNGSFDFATCDARDVDSFDIAWVHRDSSALSGTQINIPVVGKVEEGDVFHFDIPAPRDGWHSVSVASRASRDGLGILGSFNAEDLASGDWVWNQTGLFVATVDVKHCDLDEANAR